MTPLLPSLLQVESLTFHHGSRAILQDVSFTAAPGECIALLGANGQGKSTLLDLLSGFRTPASGYIRIDSRALAAWPPNALARTVSHLPQAVHADLPFTAGQLVAMGRYPHSEHEDGIRDRWFESPADHVAIEAAMARTGCASWQHRPLATLSGGERQRVLLAACLAQDARILLLDEPSTYLDIEQQLACFTLLADEAARGRLVLAVTHDLNLALSFCTRLIVLDHGRIVRDLSVAAAAHDSTWLPLFSPRLRLGETAAGTPWVWYA